MCFGTNRCAVYVHYGIFHLYGIVVPPACNKYPLRIETSWMGVKLRFFCDPGEHQQGVQNIEFEQHYRAARNASHDLTPKKLGKRSHISDIVVSKLSRLSFRQVSQSL